MAMVANEHLSMTRVVCGASQAAPPKCMMPKPRAPSIRLVALFQRDCVKLVQEGERETERRMRKELAEKRKAAQVAQAQDAQAEADRYNGKVESDSDEEGGSGSESEEED